MSCDGVPWRHKQESALMPKLKYDHPVIQKGAVQVFAHLAQKPMSADLCKVGHVIAVGSVDGVGCWWC